MADGNFRLSTSIWTPDWLEPEDWWLRFLEHYAVTSPPTNQKEVTLRSLTPQFCLYFFSFENFLGHTTPHVGSSFPDQRLKLCLLHWKHWVLTTGLPGKSSQILPLKMFPPKPLENSGLFWAQATDSPCSAPAINLSLVRILKFGLFGLTVSRVHELECDHTLTLVTLFVWSTSVSLLHLRDVPSVRWGGNLSLGNRNPAFWLFL